MMIKLETDRLILRDYEKSDFDAYFRLKTDNEIMCTELQPDALLKT